MSDGVQAGAGQLVKGRDEQGAETSAGASVGEVDGVGHQGYRVSSSNSSPADFADSFFSADAAVPLIVCARVFVRLLAATGRSIICARQDDSSLLIDQWIDQYTLKEHLVEQLLQVGGCNGVEAMAVLEKLKGLGEVLADFGGVGLIDGQLTLNLVQLDGELNLFLLEPIKGHHLFVVSVQ